MSNTIIAGIFTIIGIVIGGLFQRSLRSEKLKEVFYKEKILAVKEVSQGLWDLFITAHDISTGKLELKELTGKVDEVLFLLGRNSLFLSNALRHKINKTITDTQGLLTSGIGKPVLEELDMTVKTKTIESLYGDLITVLRDDLHSDPVMKSIKGYFKAKQNPFAKRQGLNLAENSNKDIPDRNADQKGNQVK